MKRRTREKIDGFAMVVGSMIAPVIVWAQEGAKTELAAIIVVTATSFGAGLAAVRLWLSRDPRAPVAPLPPPGGAQ